jgi:hypothetical protein
VGTFSGSAGPWHGSFRREDLNIRRLPSGSSICFARARAPRELVSIPISSSDWSRPPDASTKRSCIACLYPQQASASRVLGSRYAARRP